MNSKKLKEFFITFDPDNFESGVDMIAITDNPAIKMNALRFNDNMSFDNYPQSVVDNAIRGIELNEAQDNKCATQVGKVRAQQLANKESISIETVERMFSFLSRAKEFYNPEDTEACGTISYLLWGGEEALEWSKSVLDSLEQGMEEKEYKFSINKEKQIIAGPVMIPNKRIYRRDKQNGEYYVIFTSDVIEKMVEKFFSEKRDVIFNIDHTDETIQGFIKGSWIVADPNNDKANFYKFNNLPEGTFFIEAKINNEDHWEKIKEMESVGFSVEGLMGLLKTNFKTFNKMSEKRKFVAHKLATKSMFSLATKQFEEVLVSEEEDVLIVEDLSVGSNVEVLDKEARIVTAEDGMYVVESEEVTITIEDGEIKSVDSLTPTEEVVEETEETEETTQEMSEETTELQEEVDNTMVMQIAEVLAKMAEFETRLESLEANIAEKEEEESMQFNSNTKESKLSFIKSLTK